MCSIAYLFLLQDKRGEVWVKGQTKHKKTLANDQGCFMGKRDLPIIF